MTASRHRALIVDDEPLARERLRTLLADDPEVEVVGEYGRTGGRPWPRSAASSPDLVFLDIRCRALDGFGVVAEVGGGPDAGDSVRDGLRQVRVRAFEVNAVDYLLKPFDRDRFTAAS